MSVARQTEAPAVTTSAYAASSSNATSAAGRPVTPHTKSIASTNPAKMAMLPPEIAMTWYVPAVWSRSRTSSGSPVRSPMSTAVTMAAETPSCRPT